MKSSQLLTDLYNRGPLLQGELPRRPTPEERQNDGVRKFKVRGGPGIRTSLGNTPTVYYVEGKHEPETVCTVWLDNLNVDPEEHARAIYQRVSNNTEFGDAMREALGDVDLSVPNPDDWENNAGNIERECPMCGKTFVGHLPNHLPCEASP